MNEEMSVKGSDEKLKQEFEKAERVIAECLVLNKIESMTALSVMGLLCSRILLLYPDPNELAKNFTDSIEKSLNVGGGRNE